MDRWSRAAIGVGLAFVAYGVAFFIYDVVTHDWWFLPLWVVVVAANGWSMLYAWRLLHPHLSPYNFVASSHLEDGEEHGVVQARDDADAIRLVYAEWYARGHLALPTAINLDHWTTDPGVRIVDNDDE